MKRSLKLFVEFIIVMIALGAALFSFRVPIGDWVREQMKPELPVATTFEEVIEEKTEVLPKVEDVKVEVKPKVVQKPEEKEVLPLPKGEFPPEADQPLAEEGVAVNESEELAASVNLAVPFTPQAPHADWSEPYKEACEEASVYMVHAFYQGVPGGRVDPEMAKSEIDKIVEFEMGLFGYYEDTTAVQTASFSELMFGYENVVTIVDPTVEIIKEHLAAGRPVIVPAAGRLLGNPYFQQPGPLYHMLVLRGYTESGKFITNDPGTRRGEAFLYDFDTIMNAMHDWNNGDVLNGQKVVVVIYPN